MVKRLTAQRDATKIVRMAVLSRLLHTKFHSTEAKEVFGGAQRIEPSFEG